MYTGLLCPKSTPGHLNLHKIRLFQRFAGRFPESEKGCGPRLRGPLDSQPESLFGLTALCGEVLARKSTLRASLNGLIVGPYAGFDQMPDSVDADRSLPPHKFLTGGRITILVGFLAALVMIFMSGAGDYLSLEALSANRERLLDFVQSNAVVAILAFMGIYVAAVAFSIPGAIWLTIAGGFVFGSLAGTLYIVVAATIGATLVFLLARYVLGDVLRAKAGNALKKMEDGFRKNALSYLFVLRLVPLFPFFLVNLVPAFLGVPLRTYVIGTFFGIIPGTFVYATVGAGIGDALAAGAGVDPAAALRQPTVIGALAGLVVLALIPVAYKRIKSRG